MTALDACFVSMLLPLQLWLDKGILPAPGGWHDQDEWWGLAAKRYYPAHQEAAPERMARRKP